MNIKDFAEGLAKIGLPLLGAALPLPGGAALGTALASAITGSGSAKPEDILLKLGQDASALQQAKNFELTHQETMLRVMVDAQQKADQAAVDAATSVNNSMQAESKSDHWPTYTWRPFIGFVFGLMGLTMAGTVATCYLGVMFGGVNPSVLSMLPAMLGAMIGVMGVISPILGIASWFRGKAQADPSVSTDNRG